KLKLFEQEGQDLGTGTLSGVFFAGLGPCPHVLPWTMKYFFSGLSPCRPVKLRRKSIKCKIDYL
ncbi:MAG: hypothetical protein ACOYVK_07370, partial [Bacillota bacterium]